jgi:hypothetical protein
MAINWVSLSNTEGHEVHVNLDNVSYMRRTQDNKWTVLTFVDHAEQFSVKETPEEVRSKSSIGHM